MEYEGVHCLVGKTDVGMNGRGSSPAVARGCFCSLCLDAAEWVPGAAGPHVTV
jgi:hypothetical protein